MRPVVTKAFLVLIAAFLLAPLAAKAQTPVICIFKQDVEQHDWEGAIKHRGDIMRFMHFCCKQTKCKFANVREKGKNLVHYAAEYRQEKALIYFMTRDKYLTGKEAPFGEPNTKEEEAALNMMDKLKLTDITSGDLANEHSKSALNSLFVRCTDDDKGATPGMLAARSGSLPITKFMIKWGPTPKLKDAQGRDMLWYAQQSKNPDPGFMDYLRKAYETAMNPSYSSKLEMEKKILELKDGVLNNNLDTQRKNMGNYIKPLVAYRG